MSIKISQLPAGTAPTGTEVGPFVQAGTTVKLTTAQLSALSISIVTSIASLAANNGSTFTSVYLNSGGLSGIFAWNSSNLSTAVTNDPGKGIYVPPTSAPSGASGAWVRRYSGAVDWAWWGAIGDGVTTDPWGTPVIVSGTDNSVSFNNWWTWAKHQSSLGLNVVVQPSPGQYNWSSLNIPFYWFSGVKNLHIIGNNNVGLQNTETNGTVFPFQIVAFPTGYLINQTTIGAFSFTTTSSGDAANLKVGSWVMLASLDTQMNGAPINPENFEFVEVTAVNLGSGAATINQPIQYQHRTDYPDYNLSGAGFQCGKARVWVFEDGWDGHNQYDGLTVNLSPGGGAAGYASFAKRKTTTRDWVGIGFSETLTASVAHYRATQKTGGEPDKCMDDVAYYDCDLSHSGLSFQSSTPNRLRVFGGILNDFVGAGKDTHLDNVAISTFQPGCQYGVSRSIILDNCVVRNVGNGFRGGVTDGVQDPGTVISIDGVKVSYANGIFTLNKVAIGFDIGLWNTVPGMFIGLEANISGGFNNAFPGNTGIGIVLSISDDATNYYVNTTLPFATVPSWASNRLLLFKVNQILFNNCTGSDQVRMASEACAKGVEYYTRQRYLFGGVYSNTSTTIYTSGDLTKLECNVIQPGTTGAATIAITFNTADATTFASDSGGTVATFNIGVAGKRVITQTTYTGKTGTDALTVAGSPSSFLPVGKVNWVQASYTFSGVPGSTLVAPLFELITTFDMGIVRRELINATLSGAVALPTQGVLL